MIIVPPLPSSAAVRARIVYVVEADQTAHMRPVTLGDHRRQRRRRSTSGIDRRSLVVMDGQDKLQEGSKVDIRTPNARGAPARRKGREPGAMSPSRPFILRPVATSLLMAGILLAGFVAYRQLPVSALPEVDYPTIQVLTFYPGASPEVMASSVTAPLERQFGQVPGLKQMTSTARSAARSSRCSSPSISTSTSPSSRCRRPSTPRGTYLPRDLPNPPIYSKSNPADAPILTLALTSNTLAAVQSGGLADTTLAQKISQLPGVGLVSISGGQRPAVRIQANPDGARRPTG